MGVIKRGILGGFQNKVGNVVGTSWKGIDVIKALPVSVANPRTSLQVRQRGKFSGVVKLGSFLLISVVKPLWDRFAQRQSGFNAFCSSNIDAFNQTGILNPDQIIISKGVLAPLADLVVNTGNDGDDFITLNWDASLGNNGQADDRFYCVVMDDNSAVIGVASATQVRSDTSATVNLTRDLVTGENIYVYVGMRSNDGFRVSNSQYNTFIVLA